jgi:hypothetical protein
VNDNETIVPRGSILKVKFIDHISSVVLVQNMDLTFFLVTEEGSRMIGLNIRSRSPEGPTRWEIQDALRPWTIEIMGIEKRLLKSALNSKGLKAIFG